MWAPAPITGLRTGRWSLRSLTEYPLAATAAADSCSLPEDPRRTPGTPRAKPASPLSAKDQVRPNYPPSPVLACWSLFALHTAHFPSESKDFLFFFFLIFLKGRYTYIGGGKIEQIKMIT